MSDPHDTGEEQSAEAQREDPPSTDWVKFQHAYGPAPQTGGWGYQQPGGYPAEEAGFLKRLFKRLFRR